MKDYREMQRRLSKQIEQDFPRLSLDFAQKHQEMSQKFQKFLQENQQRSQSLDAMLNQISLKKQEPSKSKSIHELFVKSTIFVSEFELLGDRFNGFHRGWGDEQLLKFIELIKNNKTLISIDLSNNKIGPKGFKSLCDFLKLNQYISEVNLNNNLLTTSSVPSIVDLIKNNKSIQVLKLSRNNINSAGCKAITDELKRNTTNIYLQLSNNTLRYDPSISNEFDEKSEAELDEILLQSNNAYEKAVIENTRLSSNVSNLIFSYVGYREQKIKAAKEKMDLQLLEQALSNFDFKALLKT